MTQCYLFISCNSEDFPESNHTEYKWNYPLLKDRQTLLECWKRAGRIQDPGDKTILKIILDLIMPAARLNNHNPLESLLRSPNLLSDQLRNILNELLSTETSHLYSTLHFPPLTEADILILRQYLMNMFYLRSLPKMYILAFVNRLIKNDANGAMEIINYTTTTYINEHVHGPIHTLEDTLMGIPSLEVRVPTAKKQNFVLRFLKLCDDTDKVNPLLPLVPYLEIDGYSRTIISSTVDPNYDIITFDSTPWILTQQIVGFTNTAIKFADELVDAYEIYRKKRE